MKFAPTFPGSVRQEDITIGKSYVDESACDEKDEGVQQEVILAKQFTVKGSQRYFMTLESTEGKWLEADPDLERSMPVNHGVGKMLPEYCKLSREKGQVLFPERNTLIGNVLNYSVLSMYYYFFISLVI